MESVNQFYSNGREDIHEWSVCPLKIICEALTTLQFGCCMQCPILHAYVSSVGMAWPDFLIVYARAPHARASQRGGSVHMAYGWASAPSDDQLND